MHNIGIDKTDKHDVENKTAGMPMLEKSSSPAFALIARSPC
jgi:hypothetical protein